MNALATRAFIIRQNRDHLFFDFLVVFFFATFFPAFFFFFGIKIIGRK